MADDELYFVKERVLDYPVFDSDNHMYENTDAFTKFVPKSTKEWSSTYRRGIDPSWR